MLYSDAHCLYMRLCSAREGGDEPPLYTEAYTRGVLDTIECQLCEQLVQPLWVYLEDNETIAQLAQFFGDLCNEKFLQPDLQGMVWSALVWSASDRPLGAIRVFVILCVSLELSDVLYSSIFTLYS